MNQLLDRLYCGAFVDVPTCHEQGITCVLSLCEQAPEPVPGVTMLHAPITDEVHLPAPVWAELTTLLAKQLRHGHTVLVHCRLGVSRAPSLCAAYMAQAGLLSIGDALDKVRACRDVASPHVATWGSVLEWYAYESRRR